jgi:hypothetical protein
LVIPLRLADRLGFRDAVNRRVRRRTEQRRPNSGDKAFAIVAMLAAGGEHISDVDVLPAGSINEDDPPRCRCGSIGGSVVVRCYATTPHGFKCAIGIIMVVRAAVIDEGRW